jgi:acetyltransferase-like isoleucine patch superfamily enzyme
MKKIFNALACLMPFSFLRVFLLNILGNKVSYKSKLGWGVYLVDEIELKEYSRIGMLNFIRVNELNLSKNAFIKNLNYIKGPFNVVLGEKSGIAMQNKIRRAYHPITYGISELKLGYNTFIVSNNFFDLTRSIILEDNTIIAGIRTEFWTHGYVHDSEGEGRIRIDGEIHLGNNVYVGSRCLFNPGVTIGNAINIGGNSVISKDLNEPGMYVNQSLRFLKKDIHSVKQKMTEIKGENLIEKVYIKS